MLWTIKCTLEENMTEVNKILFVSKSTTYITHSQHIIVSPAVIVVITVLVQWHKKQGDTKYVPPYITDIHEHYELLQMN